MPSFPSFLTLTHEGRAYFCERHVMLASPPLAIYRFTDANAAFEGPPLWAGFALASNPSTQVTFESHHALSTYRLQCISSGVKPFSRVIVCFDCKPDLERPFIPTGIEMHG